MLPDLVIRSCSFRASLVAQTVKNSPAVQETSVQSLGWEDPLEKGMATHCSILAWSIPWTEAPGQIRLSNWHTSAHITIQCCPACVSSNPSAGENLRNLVYRLLSSYRTRRWMLRKQMEGKSSICPPHVPVPRALPPKKKLGRADIQRQEKWGHQGTCLPSHISSLT